MRFLSGYTYTDILALTIPCSHTQGHWSHGQQCWLCISLQLPRRLTHEPKEQVPTLVNCYNCTCGVKATEIVVYFGYISHTLDSACFYRMNNYSCWKTNLYFNTWSWQFMTANVCSTSILHSSRAWHHLRSIFLQGSYKRLSCNIWWLVRWPRLIIIVIVVLHVRCIYEDMSDDNWHASHKETLCADALAVSNQTIAIQYTL